MRLLLDTNIVIWMLTRPERIRTSVLQQLADPANELVVSTGSILEIASKVSRGRLAFDQADYARLVSQVRLLEVLASHAWRVASLPPLHTDPFDRLFVAQAIEEGMILVTGDHALAQYDVTIILT